MKFRMTIENAALAQRAGLAATAAWLLAAGASDAAAQSRDLTMLCQGGGSMVVELAPAANNATQVVLAIRAVMSDVGPEQPPTAGQCATTDAKLRESIQNAWLQEPGRQRTPPAMIRMSTRQSLILAVEVQADQSPRVILASRPADARAEQAMQLYQAALQGRTFSMTLRPVARRPLEYEIVGSSIRQ